MRRRESLHIYSVVISLVKMKGSCAARRAPIEKASTELFPLPGGSSGARGGPKKKFGKSEVATKMAASSNHSIFTVSRDHLDEGRKTFKKKVFNLGTFLKKAVFNFEVDRRLESLHFKGGS